jgi:Tol biopolymer transport system component
MRIQSIVVSLAVGVACAAGQIRITAVQELRLPAEERWMAPGWSPDGRAFFVTSVNYRGLWRYDFTTGTVAEITKDAGAGFGWSVSSDGAIVAYRRTIDGVHAGERTQEIIRVDLTTGASSTLTAAPSVDSPVFAGDALIVNSAAAGYRSLGKREPAGGSTVVLGIENTKIALLKDGRKIVVDPFGDGSYIWPSLSPDGTRLLAYDMARGAFVCDLEGNVLARFGRLDAPVWTRDGLWIVSMKEQNDGHVITGSDLFASSADGTQRVQLTGTPAIELAPSCSPVDNRILCATAEGTILVLTYEEIAR